MRRLYSIEGKVTGRGSYSSFIIVDIRQGVIDVRRYGYSRSRMHWKEDLLASNDADGLVHAVYVSNSGRDYSRLFVVQGGRIARVVRKPVNFSALYNLIPHSLLVAIERGQLPVPQEVAKYIAELIEKGSRHTDIMPGGGVATMATMYNNVLYCVQSMPIIGGIECSLTSHSYGCVSIHVPPDTTEYLSALGI